MHALEARGQVGFGEKKGKKEGVGKRAVYWKEGKLKKDKNERAFFKKERQERQEQKVFFEGDS